MKKIKVKVALAGHCCTTSSIARDVLMFLHTLHTIVVTAVTTTQQCSSKIMPAGVCLRSEGYTYTKDVTDPMKCCAECFADLPRCVAFEIRSRGGSPTKPVYDCILKNASSLNTPFANKDCLGYGFVGPAPSPPSPSPSPPGPTPGPPAPGTPPALNDMFHGGAVLQRGKTVSVWGYASTASVTVALSGGVVLESSKETTTTVPLTAASNVHVVAAVNSSGVYMAHLPPQTAAWNRTLTVTDGRGKETSVVLSIGEAVLCVGQSNMGMQVGPSVRAFDADNATAEGAAAGFYTGKISLHSRISQWQAARGSNVARHGDQGDSTIWYSVDPISIKNFSAVCWRTGKDMFRRLGGHVPVGLVVNSMGAHPIESWLGPEQLAKCNIDSMCTNAPLSQIWAKTVIPMQPFSFATMVYDQAEADIQCHLAKVERIAQYVNLFGSALHNTI